MRILLINHKSAESFKGGDSLQVSYTGRLLNERGHIVASTNSSTPLVSGFDIAHIFNCRNYNSFLSQVRVCKDHGIPIVVSPIWISVPQSFWGSRASKEVIQLAINNDSQADKAFDELKNRRYVWHNKGFKYCSHGGNHEKKFGIDYIRTNLSQSNGLIINSLLELQSIRRDLLWTGSTYEIAYYGVDSKIFLNADPGSFRKFSNIKDPFILQAGRIEPAKNQAMLCWALRKSSLPIVLVGSSENWPTYKTLCKSIYGDRLYIFDHLPQDLLASAYAAAEVHVLPSWMETCGLVSLEAALSGTPVVASNFGYELEYLEKDAFYVDPADPQTISDSVYEAMNEGKNGYRTKNLKNRILSKFTWEKTVVSTEKLYKSVLSR